VVETFKNTFCTLLTNLIVSEVDVDECCIVFETFNNVFCTFITNLIVFKGNVGECLFIYLSPKAYPPQRQVGSYGDWLIKL